MDHKDVKLWMKVVPHSKTPDGRTQGLENSIVWKKAIAKGQPFLYVCMKRPNGDYPECLLTETYGKRDYRKKSISVSGDYFLSSDFEKYKKTINMKTKDLKKGDHVYLNQGYEVEFIGFVDDGFLVKDIYDEDGLFEDVLYNGTPYFVEQIFINPPKEKINFEIVQLQNKIKQLKEEQSDIQDKIIITKRDQNDWLKKYERFNQLKRLNDYLDGKITHIVLFSWDMKIIEFTSDEMKSDEDRYNKKLRLLTLFGESNGDLTWKINEYSDGSGSDTECLPCCSYEEAVEALQNYIDNYDKEYNSYVIKAAEKYNLKLDKQKLREYYQKNIDNINKDMSQKSENLTKQLEEVKKFEKKLEEIN